MNNTLTQANQDILAGYIAQISGFEQLIRDAQRQIAQISGTITNAGVTPTQVAEVKKAAKPERKAFAPTGTVYTRFGLAEIANSGSEVNEPNFGVCMAIKKRAKLTGCAFQVRNREGALVNDWVSHVKAYGIKTVAEASAIIKRLDAGEQFEAILMSASPVTPPQNVPVSPQTLIPVSQQHAQVPVAAPTPVAQATATPGGIISDYEFKCAQLLPGATQWDVKEFSPLTHTGDKSAYGNSIRLWFKPNFAVGTAFKGQELCEGLRYASPTQVIVIGKRVHSNAPAPAPSAPACPI